MPSQPLKSARRSSSRASRRCRAASQLIFLAFASNAGAQEPLPRIRIGGEEVEAPSRISERPGSSATSAGDRAVLSSPTHAQESKDIGDIPSISTSIPALYDLKRALFDRGFNFRVNYTGETLGNPKGGVKRGLIYEGLLELVVDGDLEKIASMKGATFHVNAFEIHGRGLSTCCISNYSTISSIEAAPNARLFDAWFEQKMFDGAASIRIGQLAADNEFFISDFGALFVNATFGWPTITAANLPSGGPAYPLATPGVRLKISPNEQLTLLAALYNGDPSGARFSGLQEIKEPAGVSFRLKDPPLLIAEAQFKHDGDETPLGRGTVKLGAWRHFGQYDDQRFGVDRLSLADPSSNGVPLRHRGDFGVYGVIDQMVWRFSDDPAKGVGIFARVSASPPDRSLMSFYVEGGVNFVGALEARPDDIFGLAAAYSRISPSVGAFDRDAAFFTADPFLPARDFELAVELAYQAQIIPGWIVQPDFQYIIHPGAGAVDPIHPASGRIRDAAILGVRTVIKY